MGMVDLYLIWDILNYQRFQELLEIGLELALKNIEETTDENK